MNLEIGAPSTGSRPLRGLGLPHRPARGVLLVEYGLFLVLAVVVSALVVRGFGMGVGALFAVAASTL